MNPDFQKSEARNPAGFNYQFPIKFLIPNAKMSKDFWKLDIGHFVRNWILDIRNSTGLVSF